MQWHLQRYAKKKAEAEVLVQKVNRKTPSRKIPTHQTPTRKTPIRKLPTHQTPTHQTLTRKITTWNIPTHVFKHSQPSFLIFCFFIIVTVIIDIN